ncbi:glycosyltransferase family 1 protein, partial [Streptomyces hainanensis]
MNRAGPSPAGPSPYPESPEPLRVPSPEARKDGSVLTVVHLAQPVDGGVARVVTDLVRAQTHVGIRAVVLCPSGGELGRAAAAAGADVRLWHAERAPGPNLPWEVAFAARAIRRAAPDLVHLHSAKAGLAGRLALRGRLPTVFQPHAWSFEAVDGATARLATRWERYATRWTHRVLCVSEEERRQAERAGIAAGHTVIRNGVDLARHPAADGVARRQARAALAAVHGLPQRAPLVVCVGRLCPQKGQDLLLRAWPGVLERFPAARLALVGDGPERAALRRAAGPEVLFAGHTDDTLPWYAAADLVVLPSRWEGMALAPIEAMAAGRPVLLTDVGGARESLPPGHAPHCLVPPADPRALAGAVTA